MSSEAKVLLEVINPAVLNSSRVPVTSIAALLPVLVFTSTPSVSDHVAVRVPISNFLNVEASNTRVLLSLIIISLKESTWPSVKAFKAIAIFSAVS